MFLWINKKNYLKTIIRYSSLTISLLLVKKIRGQKPKFQTLKRAITLSKIIGSDYCQSKIAHSQYEYFLAKAVSKYSSYQSETKYWCTDRNWLCWGLMTRQPLWVILCHLPEKGRKVIVDVRKARDWEKEEQKWKWRNRRNKNFPPLPLPATRIAGLAQLWSIISWTPWWRKLHIFATPDHPKRV